MHEPVKRKAEVKTIYCWMIIIIIFKQKKIKMIKGNIIVISKIIVENKKIEKLILITCIMKNNYG